MKVVVTSRETIKPSSPTPDHNRILQQSFIDQINIRNIIPYIHYYTSDDCIRPTSSEKCHLLKKSLSEALTRFYPLAGRLRNNLYVECNDDGVPFLESRVQSQLSNFVRNPNFDDLNKFLPCDQLDDAGDIPLSVQVNIFDCGGVAIGTCFSHKIADGLSVVTFLNFWAKLARGVDVSNMPVPRFDIATFFPPRDISGYKRSSGTTKEKTVAKSFVFSDSAISALKSKYAMGLDTPKPPSRLEVLTTFIWSRLVAAYGGGRAVVQAMNLRGRANPPLPESYFGNLSRFATFVPSIDSNGNEGCRFINQMREAIKKIDSDYVKNLQEGGNVIEMSSSSNVDSSKLENNSLVFASNFLFPLYEVDFGWGKPIWVSFATLPFKNSINFLPRRAGVGIEAWFFMKEDDLAKLEADKEFLAFVSPTSGAQDLLPSSL